MGKRMGRRTPRAITRRGGRAYFLAAQAPHFLAAQAPHFFAAQAPHFLAAHAPHFLAPQAPHFLALVAAQPPAARQPALAHPPKAAAVTTAEARVRASWFDKDIMVILSWGLKKRFTSPRATSSFRLRS
jgi:hypothetical protein